MAGNNRRLSRQRLVLLISTILLFVALLVAIAVLAYAELENGQSPAIILYVLLSVAIGAIAIRLAAVQHSNFRLLREGLRDDLSESLEGIKLDMSKLLSSRVEVKDSRDALLESVSDLYSDAANAAKGARAGQVIVVLFGASSVQPKASETTRGAEGDATQTPYDRFMFARKQAEDAGVIFQRYVRLFDDKNFMGRSPEIRDGYLVWLQEQIDLMKRSPLYQLTNARRAPRWKAIRSSIITDSFFIDVLGDGESGFVMKGRDFCRSQQRNAEAYINSTEGGRSPILDKFDKFSVGRLEEHLKEMRELNSGGPRDG